MYGGLKGSITADRIKWRGRTRANVVRKFHRVSVTSEVTYNKRRGTNNTIVHFAQSL